MVNIQVVVLLVMLATSAAQWWQWSLRWKRTGIVCPRNEQLPAPWNPVALGFSLLMIALLLWTTLSSTGDSERTAMTLSTTLNASFFNVTLFGVMLLLLIANDARRLHAIGFNLDDWQQQCRLGLETGAASLLPVFIVLVASLPFREEAGQHPMLRLLTRDPSLSTLGAVLFAAVVSAPLLEELLFRVILLGRLKSFMRPLLAIGFSSVAFAAVHGAMDGLALLPLAVMLGWLFDRQHRFLPVFVAHAFFNLWNIVLVLSSR